MAYQDFPWQPGGSQSFNKLVSLSLPVLQGKSVLDVGCNEGFFCGWASFQKASRVKGIDKNPLFIEQARTWFPECSFICMDWNDLGRETFDVILCLSAIHYADDPESLIALLMSRLTPDGVLVLEIGIADGSEEIFVPVTRRITEEITDTRLFPTQSMLRRLLGNYAFKHMGQSVLQAGDPTPRHVYHIYHKKPLALLLLDEHYSGKSSIVDAVMKPDLNRIFGEKIYHQIADGELPASDALKHFMEYVPGTRHMIPPQITSAICKAGLLSELMAVFATLADKRDFILEHYIPADFRLEACEILDRAGFYVVDIAILAAHKKSWTTRRPPYARYQSYIEYLKKISTIDEEAYLAANPSVAQAVADGTMPCGQFHYWKFGKREKRRPR
ncbi:MAG: class I SAM-dependent methyltransferase [Desulfovibrionaceae bacterium]|nr:class I SAM-dependent methyltransferase [Desulfovibrionaceae bacterium]